MRPSVGAILLGAALLTAACSSSTPPPAASNQATAGDPVGEAYRLILQRSVLKVDPATIAAAGVDGLRGQLLADGVTPPDVPSPTFTPNASQDLQLLHATLQRASLRYSSKLTSREADDAMIAAMARKVGDCHTVFFTPSQLSQQLAWIQGQEKFGGIGASLRKDKGQNAVVLWRVFAGSPAQKAGLREGDSIVAVDGKDVSALSVQSVVDLVRGPVGAPVRLTVRPAGQTTTRIVQVARGQIQPPTVEYRMLANHVGYVQIYGFPENAAGQLKAALDTLDREGARAWIFDARDNGGGAVDSVTRVLSMFAPRGTVLFYSYDASGKRTDYLADGSARGHLLPSVVLTNDGTGSGGEVFAAVMRELGVAQVVGSQTAGCVGTGEMFSLSDGSGLQVTVAQLFTGQGKSLNQIGVTPDVPVEMSVADLVRSHDPQLQRALQVVEST